MRDELSSPYILSVTFANDDPVHRVFLEILPFRLRNDKTPWPDHYRWGVFQFLRNPPYPTELRRYVFDAFCTRGEDLRDFTHDLQYRRREEMKKRPKQLKLLSLKELDELRSPQTR